MADGITAMLWVGFIVGAIALGLLWIGWLDMFTSADIKKDEKDEKEEEDEKDAELFFIKLKKCTLYYVIAYIIFMLVPNTSIMLKIVGAKAVVEIVENGKIQDISSKSLETLELLLDKKIRELKK
jgi:H+/gluconate symporter-like permease